MPIQERRHYLSFAAGHLFCQTSYKVISYPIRENMNASMFPFWGKKQKTVAFPRKCCFHFPCRLAFFVCFCSDNSKSFLIDYFLFIIASCLPCGKKVYTRTFSLSEKNSRVAASEFIKIVGETHRIVYLFEGHNIGNVLSSFTYSV